MERDWLGPLALIAAGAGAVFGAVVGYQVHGIGGAMAYALGASIAGWLFVQLVLRSLLALIGGLLEAIFLWWPLLLLAAILGAVVLVSGYFWNVG